MEPIAFGQHQIFHSQRLFQCPPLPLQSLFYAVHSSPAATDRFLVMRYGDFNQSENVGNSRGRAL